MSAIHDVKSKLKIESSILPQRATSDITGSEIDTQDSHGVGIVAHIGVSDDTLSPSVKIEMFLEHRNEGESFGPVADDEVKESISGAAQTGTFAIIDDPAKDALIYKANYIGQKRYVRVMANLVGTHTNGTPIAAEAVLLPTLLPA